MTRGSAIVRFRKRLLTQLLATFVLIAFGFAVATATPQAVGSELLTEAEQAMFVKGQTLHSQGLYSEAVVILSQFVELYPNSTIKDLGLLWLGRSYLAQGDLANAEKTALRLKAIGDTAMFGIYEEELRIGRQNYARSVSSSHARTDLAVMTPASPAPLVTQMATREIEKPKPVAASTEVAASQPAGKDPKAVDSITPSRPTITKSSARVTAKASTNSGLFLPSALEISTSQPGTAGANASHTSSAIPPLNNKTVVALSPASTKASVKAGPPPAQNVAASKNLIVAPPKESGAAVKTMPTSDLPLLRLKIEAMPVRFANDSAVSYRLIITNEGSGVAKDLTVRGELDASLEYVASNLLPHRQELIAQKQILTFRLPLVQPGETKVLEITVRARGAVAVNISAQTKHSIFYRDSKGNFLHTP
jgi:hypothetical protein